jgi:hypothetical protein
VRLSCLVEFAEPQPKTRKAVARFRIAAGREARLRPLRLVQCVFLSSIGRSESAVVSVFYLWGRFLRICCTPGKLTSRGP